MRFFFRNRSLLVTGLALVGATTLFTSCALWWWEWTDDGQMADYHTSKPLQDEEVIDAALELNVGTLQVESGAEADVYELDVHYDKNAFEPNVDYRRVGGTGHFRFRLSGEGKTITRIGGTRLNVRLNPKTPLRLETRTGVGESEIDLTGLKIESLRLESGVGETNLAMLDPNPTTCERFIIRSGVGALQITGLGNFAFRDFKFQGGVGASVLDFSGRWNEVGNVEIEVGVGGIEILLPRSIGAEVQFSKSFLSRISLSDFEKTSHNTYVSENRDRVSKILRLHIRAGIGGVEIRWI